MFIPNRFQSLLKLDEARRTVIGYYVGGGGIPVTTIFLVNLDYFDYFEKTIKK